MAASIAVGSARSESARSQGGALEWEPNRQLSLARARERSRFLAIFRLVCVAIAAGAMGSVVLAVGLHGVGGGFRAGELADADALTIRNPRFTGRDATGGPFMVTADTAVRQGRASPLIDLANPRYQSDDGRTVVAETGVYDSEKRTLELAKDVIFADSQQQVFRTQRAFIDTERELLRGDVPIAGAGPLGEVRADTYEVRGDLGQISLRGRVKGIITPKNERKDEP